MASSFGELVLICGDHHIPHRATSMPEPFRKMLVPNKMQRVLCTGNVGTSTEERDRLRELVGGGQNVHCVAGEYDPVAVGAAHQGMAAAAGGGAAAAAAGVQQPLPETKVVVIGQFRVGIIGGHQIVPRGDLSSLSMMRRKLNVDVLVCGSRRQEGVVEHEGEQIDGSCMVNGDISHS